MLGYRRLAAFLAAIALASAACQPGSTSPAPTSTIASVPSSPAATLTPAASLASVPTTAPAPTPLTLKDGEPWIVYQWVAGDRGSVFLMRPDGGDSHRILADIVTGTAHPDWSPDGKLIAFEVSLGDLTEIWIANADGSGAQKLIGCDGPPCVFVDRESWSPDGTKLAYVRFDRVAGSPVEAGQASIEVFDRTTGTRRVVAKPRPAGARYREYINPRWSPDGQQIAFEVTQEPVPLTGAYLGTGIAVVKADGSEVDTARILTDPTLFGAYPDWSPDGQRIVFNTYDLAGFQDTTNAVNLYTIHPDGSGLTQITHFGKNHTRATQPTWTPDGKRIIFTWVGCEPTCQDAQWGNRYAAFIDADGSNLTVLDGQPATHPRLRATH